MGRKNKYSSILATEQHKRIKSLKDMKSCDDLGTSAIMGFFLNGVPIGTVYLQLFGKNHNSVQTSSTRLFDKYVNKGHGIHLYIAAIENARKIGAKRIYSSSLDNLNQRSNRMWEEKLPKFYNVKTMKTNRLCYGCKRKGLRTLYYYIELNK